AADDGERLFTSARVDDGQARSTIQGFGRGRPSLERERDAEGGSVARRAVELERAAEGLDAVLQACEPGAVPEVGSADAVVADREQQAAVAQCGRDLDARCSRVLGGVGQGFGDDE